MTRRNTPQRRWRNVNWENVLADLCMIGGFAVYATYLRAKKAVRTLVGVARTPLQAYRLVQKIRKLRGGSKKNNARGKVEVYEVGGCRRPAVRAPSEQRRVVEYSRHSKKVASYPLYL